MRGNPGRTRRHDRGELVAPTSAAKTMLIGDRRCTLGVYCIRSGVWAPSASIDPAEPGAQRHVINGTPEQMRPSANEAMVEAQRMAERFLTPASQDPLIARALALLGGYPDGLLATPQT